jgi:hypothetical protein
MRRASLEANKESRSKARALEPLQLEAAIAGSESNSHDSSPGFICDPRAMHRRISISAKDFPRSRSRTADDGMYLPKSESRSDHGLGKLCVEGDGKLGCGGK